MKKLELCAQINFQVQFFSRALRFRRRCLNTCLRVYLTNIGYVCLHCADCRTYSSLTLELSSRLHVLIDSVFISFSPRSIIRRRQKKIQPRDSVLTNTSALTTQNQTKRERSNEIAVTRLD